MIYHVTYILPICHVTFSKSHQGTYIFRFYRLSVLYLSKINAQLNNHWLESTLCTVYMSRVNWVHGCYSCTFTITFSLNWYIRIVDFLEQFVGAQADSIFFIFSIKYIGSFYRKHIFTRSTPSIYSRIFHDFIRLDYALLSLVT